MVEQGLRVLDRIEKVYGHRFERQEALAGGAALDATGVAAASRNPGEV